ncbi:MAG: hypothetical protein JW788_07590 [Candidatus Omnitrophica bacterium]|nr:hypothetical protein [Candidatus Omnitrophota bacterium]
MACFLVPAGAAIVTTAINKKIPEKYHINWLNSMLWGGVIMLAVEHVSHGEIVLYPPFLTAGIIEALPEMMHVGIPMAAAIFVIWGVMVTAAAVMNKKTKYVDT